MTQPITTHYGFVKANPRSPDSSGHGWPPELDADLDAIDAAIFAAASGGGSMLSAKVTVSSAELIALNAAPKTLIAAPGANKVIKVFGASGRYKFVSTPYTINGNGFFAGFYAGMQPNGSTPAVLPFSIGHSNVGVAGFCDQSADRSLLDGIYQASALSWGDTPGDGPASGFVNQAMLLGLVSDPTNLAQGRIAAFDLTGDGTGGTAYAPMDTITLDGAGNGDAILVVDTVDGGGAFLTGHFSNEGTGYRPGDASSSTTSGGGSGFVANVTAVQTLSDGDGTLEVRLYYVIEDYS